MYSFLSLLLLLAEVDCTVSLFLIKEQMKYESEARTSKGAWEKKLANTQRR